MDRKAELRSFEYSYIKSFLEQDKQVFVECLLDSFLPAQVIGVKQYTPKGFITNKTQILIRGVRPHWIMLQRTMSLYTYVEVKKRVARPMKVVDNIPQVSYNIDELIRTYYTTTSTTFNTNWPSTP